MSTSEVRKRVRENGKVRLDRNFCPSRPADVATDSIGANESIVVGSSR